MVIEYVLDETRAIVLEASLRSFILDSDNIERYPNLVESARIMLNEITLLRQAAHDSNTP